jgi:hypothetical protein
MNREIQGKFWQLIIKKAKNILYKLCDKKGYTYDMKVCLRKDHANAAAHVTITHGTVLHLTVIVLNINCFMDNYFSSPQLFLDLSNSKINIYRTICHNINSMPTSFGATDMIEKRENTTCKSERRQQCCLVYSRPRGKATFIRSFCGQTRNASRPLCI